MLEKIKTSPKFLLIGAWVFCLLLLFFFLLSAYHMSIGRYSNLDALGTGLISFGLLLTLLAFRESMKQENELRIRKLFESTPVPLHCMNIAGNITRVSDMWLDFFKVPREAVIGSNFAEFLCEDSRKLYSKKVLKAFRADENCRDVQLKALVQEREVVEVFVSVSSIGYSKGNNEALVVIAPEKGRKNDAVCKKFDFYDSLTGLPNTFLLKDRIKNALERCRTSREKVAFLQIDIDRLKWTDPMASDVPSDLFLLAVAKRLKENIRTGDTLARLPGNEFGLLPYGVQNPEHLIPLADRLCRLASQPLKVGETVSQGAASIGISLYPEDGRNIETLIRKANVAMYTAKAEGGDKFHFASPKMNAQAEKRILLQKKLGKALLKEEFFLLFQPQIDLATGRTVGLEALLRWRSPQEGVVLPQHFLPVVEESDLVFVLGEWVLRQACRKIKDLTEEGYQNLRVSINISKKHFLSSGFIACVDRILGESGVDPGLLEMDMHETLLMVESGKVGEKLRELQKRGIGLAIDDYGLGRCSVAQMKYLPVKRIKIARKFLKDIPQDKDSSMLIETFIGLAQGLGLKALVKGIENKEQVNYLISLNCKEGQGFFFSEPLPLDHCLNEISSFSPQVISKSA